MEIIPGEGVVNSARIADVKAQKAAAYDKMQNQAAAEQIAGLARMKYDQDVGAETANAIANAQMQAYLDTTAKLTMPNAPYTNVPEGAGMAYKLVQPPIVDAAEHAKQMAVVGKSPYPTALNQQKYGY